MTKQLLQPIITQKELNKIKRYLRRVKAEGYRPWMTVRQSHTIGQGQIIFSHKTKRPHHFLSRGELQPFFHFEASQKVSDIFEQFPLDIGQTMKLAKELNILHPGSYEEAQEYDGRKPAKTMSLDYVVQHNDGTNHAYNFKYAASLNPKLTSPVSVARTELKTVLERAYCRKNGMTWTQLTENSFNRNVTQNLRYLRECFDYHDELDVSDSLKSITSLQLKRAFENHSTSTIRAVLEKVSFDMNMPLHQIQSLFQYFVYKKAIDFDWTTELNLNRPLPLRVIGEDYVG